MPNALVFKSFAFDQVRHGFYSPSRSDFLWGKDIVVGRCNKCETSGNIGIDCTCGLYGSPNVETIDEYHTFPNSVLAVMNTYGRLDIWTAPDDIPGCYVTRSWGMQVVFVVSDEINGKPLRSSRLASMLLAMSDEYFGVPAIPLWIAKEMIRQTWLKPEINIDPYIPHGG